MMTRKLELMMKHKQSALQIAVIFELHLKHAQMPY